MTLGAEVRPSLTIKSDSSEAPFSPPLALFTPLINSTRPTLADDSHQLRAQMSTDDTQADRQLHQTLESACRRRDPITTHGSRKHSRTDDYNDYDDDEFSSDYSSDVSGRFDDADEEYAISAHPASSPRSTHSAKRRHSNDWPVEELLPPPPLKETGSTGSRWRSPFHSRNNSRTDHGSPRNASGRHGRQAGPSGRGRRSRFIEGMMNDSVSEKPPSIFLRDGKSANGQEAPTHRSSGIFRFGKAIASAFNPFGGWGSVAVWKGSPSADANKEPVDDDIARVEKAYAELKKAGYRGAVKGEYMAGAGSQSSNNLADQTWKSIQEKMDYKAPTGRHSRQNSGEVHESGSSLRNSFQEIRRAKSSLGITSSFIPLGRRSEDTEQPQLRKQKSKREKLLRRVSTLEEKLEKARRELQELMGDDAPPVPERSQCQESTHPRKFVPGALPTLPSERLLNSHDPVSPISPTSDSAPMSLLENIQRTMQSQDPTQMTTIEPESTIKTPAKSPSLRTTQSLTVDSPSLKRKSPDPESASAANTPKSQKEGATNHTEEGNQSDSSRRSKLPKTFRGDSPGSVERKQTPRHREENSTRRSPSEERGRRRRSSQPLRSHSKRSPSARRRASNSRNRGTPSLRLKKGRADLRSASTQAMDIDNHDKENQHASQSRQDQQQSDSVDLNQTDPSPNSSPAKRKDQRFTYNYIPPVPPLPKNIAATAAKVDRRLAKEIGRRERNRKSKAQGKTNGTEDGFSWPDDIF
ncbi:hypothetical protein OAory_01106500 [Aspergillus oryzae]|uniref:Nuclear RNA binding protein n=1 Tax=Aspergillus oryzae TaxID=5062 RepID=A0A1S9DK99_ASPOZ|nr:hypothetical protein OAory_01106500 [Aspergillus oryzae]